MAKFDKNTPTALQNLTEEQRRDMAKKGAKASVEAKKEKKTMREILNMLLELKATEKEAEVFSDLLPGMNKKDITKKMALCARLMQNAISKGDSRSADFVRDTIGEAPEKNINVNGGVERVVYITAEQEEATNKHIEEVIKQ